MSFTSFDLYLVLKHIESHSHLTSRRRIPHKSLVLADFTKVRVVLDCTAYIYHLRAWRNLGWNKKSLLFLSIEMYAYILHSVWKDKSTGINCSTERVSKKNCRFQRYSIKIKWMSFHHLYLNTNDCNFL